MRRISFNLLSPEELYTLGKRLHALVGSSLTQNTFIASVLSLLNVALNNLSAILGRVTKSDYTPLLSNKDQERDNAYLGLRDYIKANLHHANTEIADAAKRLYEIFERNGLTLYTLGYAAQTAQVNVLIKDLSTDSAQADLNTLGAISWFENMTARQVEFEALYQEKIKEESVENLPLMKSSRNNNKRYISTLLSYIDIQAELEPDTYGEVLEKVNDIITDTMAIARARMSRKENDISNDVETGS